MLIARSLLLFVLAAIAEIGGAWMIWHGIRDHRGLLWVGGGIIALGLCGFVATLQPDAQFGRILAAFRCRRFESALPCPLRAAITSIGCSYTELLSQRSAAAPVGCKPEFN